jgi:hypothetical protein
VLQYNLNDTIAPLLLHTSRPSRGQQDDCTLLLMCRKPNEPYVFCGRLAQLEVNTAASPLEVRWQLLDFAALQQAPQFLDLLGAAAAPDSSE